MKLKSQIILWVALIVLAIGWVKVSDWMSPSEAKPERVPIAKSAIPPVVQEQEREQAKAKSEAKAATLEPGRVVTLDTAKGRVEFVLFEKDCPKSTARIADMVRAGAYNGITFPRVENWVIQVDKPKLDVEPMGCEFAKGLCNCIGAVGMARKQDRNSNTNIFYFLKQPSPPLDYNYTVFGQIIKGMDVVKNMQIGDAIKKATLRPSTSADAQLLKKALKAANLQ